MHPVSGVSFQLLLSGRGEVTQGTERPRKPQQSSVHQGANFFQPQDTQVDVDFFRFSQTGLEKQTAVICTAFLATARSVSSETLPMIDVLSV